NGTLTSIRGKLSDISEFKTMEPRLSQAQKMEAVGTLVGGITHDFNNILQAISGYAEVLMIKKDKDHPEYMNLSAMRRAIKRAGKLVQQLLIFSRKAQSQKKPLEINQEVKQAKNLLEKTIPKMIEIRTDLAKNLLQVHADPVQIEQVILNLGSNAADAMPQGGKIYIKTSNVTIDHNNITDHAGTVMGNHILLSISDNGHGMDAETLDKIFEPFFTTKSPGKGTGLGLSSVYGIVQNHGGNILCNSEESKGTTFKIYLPAMSEKIEEEATKEEFEARGGNETVLVVDDEDEIRKMTSVAFNHFGYTYLEAANGEKALEIYKELSNEIDLVILDISMPGMGGYKCLQALLALNPAVKTLIASGYSAEANIEDCLKLGAKGYIAKPYQFNGLLAQVRKILDQN
ncbi:MAG: response regulator, partial [Desulfobacteraceae bacterium]|nr:response regulator [Desulfobacteraceae bacterium]